MKVRHQFYAGSDARPGTMQEVPRGVSMDRRPHPAWVRAVKKEHRGDVEATLEVLLRVLRQSGEDVDVQRALAIAKQVEEAAW